MSVYLLAVQYERPSTSARVQRLRPGGQGFVEYPVAADALDADAVPLVIA